MVALILGIFLLSCNTAEAIQTPPVVETQSSPTTTTTTVTATLTSTATPYPILPESATAEALGNICIGAKATHAIEISPNGKWIAATCYWENDNQDSPLQISSMDGTKNWKIYFSNYKTGDAFDRHDEVIPYHWSKDGRFIFATVGSRFEGCCWIGGRYVLLVRLNLETGGQLALLNTDHDSADAFDFIISDSDRYMLFTPPSNQPYDFAILDFQTWETKEVFLKFHQDIDAAYAIMSPDEEKVILPLFKNLEFNDYYVDSIALVNLITGEQEILISEMTPENELLPVQWKDNGHVLISNVNPVYNVENKKERLWLLDINSGQKKEETP